ncbi:hypothetical protein CAC42_82 [Sphaceloma murrayae]|uniref:Uncharacterized protein n=1 Tax=Sphaceloma murrayae TaxID=2082308 RepID=A0A2K1QNL1_9PEZI|nr:hypothetical protein CAC42_82 [Sphaceloma murrayae]
MKVVYVALAAAGIVAAHPHQHNHLHLHKHVKRNADADAAVEVVTIAGPTVVLYSLNGKDISEADVNEGIKNGTLVWADGAPRTVNTIKTQQKKVQAEPAPAAPSPTTTTTAAPAPTPESSESAKVVTPVITTSDSSSNDWSSATGLDVDFPDGEVDCSDFPSQYGALDLGWYGLGGWIGVQNPGVSHSGGYDHIETVLSSSCSGSDCCSEGMFCSYACPPGYQKTQWPALQGATAQSVGGLQCQGGKLRLTNSGLSSKLCMQGTDAVRVEVVNKLSEQVSVCRTDYPGTESETVPVSVSPGGTSQLTCPDTSNYYKWLGQPTSAQYYVNPKGVGVQDACKWGNGGNTGNWAPLNLGAGYSNGIAFISMLPNKPTTDEVLDFKVTLSGGDMGQTCVYANGQFTSDVISGGSSDAGCTISSTSGTLTYTFESL